MKSKLLSLTIAVMLLMTPMAVQAAGEEEEETEKVTAEEFTETLSAADGLFSNAGLHKTGVSGEALRFDFEDFAQLGLGAETLEGILISALPAVGRLSFGGRAILAGEAVTAASLNALTYIPAGNYDVKTEFTFYPVFSTGVAAEPVTVNIALERRENHPPVAADMQIKTYKNIAVGDMFKASDPDGDPLTYRVTSKAKRGEFEILPDGSFRYTPYQNKTGKDSVTYVAVDSFGNTSEPARIDIKIDKPETKTTYQDMDGHPAYYAAIRLIENNIFIGEQLGGKYYFNPDSPLTRGEFIVMVMKAIGEDEPANVNVTGFADDEQIPGWIKPYAQAALKAGIISGVETGDGRKYLMANNDISLAEATCMINNAIQVTDVGADYAANGTVPVWAAQAGMNMEAVGVISPAVSQDWGTPVFRGDCAQMLNKAIEVYETTHTRKSGLLSWVFGW